MTDRTDLVPLVSRVGSGNPLDAAANAGRVALVDAQGDPIYPTPTGSYVLPIGLQLQGSAGTQVMPAGSVVWVLHNGSEKIIAIRRVRLLTTYVGTVRQSAYAYGLARFTGDCAPQPADRKLDPVKKRTTFVDAAVEHALQSNGATPLIKTAMLLEPTFYEHWGARTPGAATPMVVDFGESPYDQLELQPGEGLAVLLVTAGFAGDVLSGSCAWEDLELRPGPLDDADTGTLVTPVPDAGTRVTPRPD